MNSYQGIIHIKRLKSFIGIASKIHIFLDNNEIIKLSSGQDASFSISPGVHSLYITAPLYKSPIAQFNITPGETVEFECGPALNGFFIKQSEYTKSSNGTVQQIDKNSPPQKESLRELNSFNEMDTYSEDEFPIDNRFGSEILTIEHEVSKTASNELIVDSKTDKGGGFGADISFFKAQIAANLSKQIGHTIGETITRKQKFTFTVKPGETALYKVIWKRKIRSGEYLVSVNDKAIPIAYRVEYDLVCEVKTAAAKE